MTELSVALVQTHLAWEDEQSNFNHFSKLIAAIGNCDLIVLPEMFSTGFSMRPELFASENGLSVQTELKKWAKQKNTAICGSAMVKDENNFYNRFYFVEPNENITVYNKAHLFRMGHEHRHYAAGKQQVLIYYKGFTLAPFICYDLRFPVWLKRTTQFNYHVMIVVANWPERRSKHWKVLLQARAIENQCYVLAVNRTGADGNGVNHSGDSMIINPMGEILYCSNKPTEIITQTISLDEVLQYRKSFPVDLDNDNFKIF